MYKKVKKFRKKHDVYEQIHTFLAMYNTALTTPTEDTAFLVLWGICEILTFKGDERHTIVVQRIKGLHTVDDELFLDRLEYSRKKRNRLVHELEMEINEDDLRFLKTIAEDLFEFVLSFSKYRKARERIVYLLDNSCKSRSRLTLEKKLIQHLQKHSKRT